MSAWQRNGSSDGFTPVLEYYWIGDETYPAVH